MPDSYKDSKLLKYAPIYFFFFDFRSGFCILTFVPSCSCDLDLSCDADLCMVTDLWPVDLCDLADLAESWDRWEARAYDVSFCSRLLFHNGTMLFTMAQ